MWKEIPALYDVARQICHDMGMPWTDPRTGITYPPPRKQEDTCQKKTKKVSSDTPQK